MSKPMFCKNCKTKAIPKRRPIKWYDWLLLIGYYMFVPKRCCPYCGMKMEKVKKVKEQPTDYTSDHL